MPVLENTEDQLHQPRRESSRLRLHLPARITLLRGNSHCLIENISRTGAQLLVEQPPVKGENGQLKCEGIDAFFETIWAVGNIIGVEFDEPIPLARIVELRQINDSYSKLQKEEIRRTARRWVSGECD